MVLETHWVDVTGMFRRTAEEPKMFREQYGGIATILELVRTLARSDNQLTNPIRRA